MLIAFVLLMVCVVWPTNANSCVENPKIEQRERLSNMHTFKHTHTLGQTNVFGHTLSLLHFVVIAGFRYETTIISISSGSDVGSAASELAVYIFFAIFAAVQIVLHNNDVAAAH